MKSIVRPTLLVINLLVLSSSFVGGTSRRSTTHHHHPRRSAAADSSSSPTPPFSLSRAISETFLGEDALYSPSSQSHLRSQLDTLLDSVGPHYSGLLRRVHELHQPQVAEMIKDLQLLVPERTTNVRHLITANDDAIGAGRRGDSTRPNPGNESQQQLKHEPPYPTPQPLPWRLSSTPSPPSLADWCGRVSSRLSALPPDAALSFPVLRRLLTAVVVRTWLDGWREGGGRMMSQADEEAARALLVQFYMIHRRGVIKRGIMDFTHVSKSGGTSWCHAAKLNGCTMPRYGLGCTVKGFDDEVVRWIDAEVHRDLTGEEPAGWSLYGKLRSDTSPGCAGRAAHMRMHNLTMYSNEYVLTGGERSMADVEVCTKQFVTAILFRHPVHRLASNLRFLLLHFKTFMDKQARAANRTTAFYRTYANANASFWQRIAPAMTNNYYIRDLLGENVWHDPVGSLTATHHLPAARLVLMQYDIVVPMEAPKEVASRVLEYGAGWPLSYKDVHEMKISALSERYEFDPTPFMPSYEEMSYLHRQQALDMELYEFAVLIGQLDYLVYETAAAWSVVPWEGMPATIDSNDTAAASFQVSCGLLRGPGGAWA